MPNYNLLIADPSLASQELSFLAPRGPAINARVRTTDVPLASWDYIVRSLADLPTPVGGYIDLTTGTWLFTGTAAINLGANVLRVAGPQNVYLRGGQQLVYNTGASLIEVAGGWLALDNVNLMNSGTDCVLITSGILSMRNSELRETVNAGANSCVRALGAAVRIRITNSRLLGATVNGLLIDADVPLVHLIGVGSDPALALAHFVHYIAGTVAAGLVTACYSAATNGITWAAANIPTRGLLVVGNDFSGATPFNGFVAADARVNCKANIGAAGLLTETAIV